MCAGVQKMQSCAATMTHCLEEMFMHGALKTFSYVVLVLMAIGIVYASFISIKYWTGISV